MRIAQYHPRAAVGDGGITNSVRRLGAEFARHGIDSVIVHAGTGSPPSTDGVEWRAVPHGFGSMVPRRPELAAAIRDADVVILNSAWTSNNAVAGSIARRADVPYVLAPRGAYDPNFRRRRQRVKQLWWHGIEHRLVAGAWGLHVFFDDQRDHLAWLGFDGHVVVAPNGVEVPDGTRWDGGSGDYLCYMGRFDPKNKGLDLLLDGLALIPADRRPRLRMHGSDWRGGKGRVAAQVRALGLDDWVAIGNPVYGEAKWSLLCAATGFVYPSRWEAFGNSLAEAAALGVPSLATPYPLARALADQGAAIVVDASAEGLADGLVAVAHPSARTIGDRAAAMVRRAYSWTEVANGWIEQLAPLGAATRSPW